MNQDQRSNPHVCKQCGQHLDNHGPNCAIEPQDQQPIPTPRHDKLLYDEACNFDVGWSEEYQKLERELVQKEQEFKSRYWEQAVVIQSLQSERDKLQQELVNQGNEVKRYEADIRKLCGKSHMSYPAINAVAELKEERDKLRKALEHYANKKMWRKEVIDSYSGECDFFDWPGDLAEEPWEIAEKALNHSKSTTQ